ncbi:hypothetical protein CHARACLAT_011931 [Characodon lateralis]|uniref:Uncharacterized protein n=1 Tax=Characodon lateralis TaxID=208331 RepID=A0ABU7DU16_9TELE|nr:hypothetical protein [Characodon lateralis]
MLTSTFYVRFKAALSDVQSYMLMCHHPQWASGSAKRYSNSVFTSSELFGSVANIVSIGNDKYKLSLTFLADVESTAANRGFVIFNVAGGVVCILRLAFFFFSCL